MEEREVLKILCEAHAPGGREHLLHPIIKDIFGEVSETTVDNINNMYIKKEGNKKGKIMVMAHADEIFLMVTSIEERGFLKFKAFGIDAKTLVSQELIIHGKKQIKGIIGIKPPHLMNDEDRKRAVKVEDLLIDTGYSKETLESIVKVGDYVTLDRKFSELLNNNVSCKATDDRAGVAALYSTVKELKDINHDMDVYFVCSAQEEVGHRGSKVASHEINPDIGIAIDTTFDSGRLGDEDRDNKLGLGPVICIGPNIHPKLRERFVAIAKEYNIPYQVEVEPGNTGTDAWDIQVAKTGIPTLLISIPIRYMHTSVEVINIDDIKNTGRIIAKFIEKLKGEELEELLCF